jgi:hypothetical protein
VGLQIGSGIPRELGSALIALILIFVATIRFSKRMPGNNSESQPRIYQP